MIPSPPAAGCRGCGNREESLVQLGVSPGSWDFLVALAGNPNTGKSTVFNALTGLRQHTGNWPGKTVTRAEGTFKHSERTVKVVDLPGTYSLQAGSTDEEVARDFLLFGQPDVTVIVVDATRLERNLNLTLQVLEVTDRVVVLLNLMDEARRHGIGVDPKALERELGVPVIPAAARQGTGIPELRDAIHAVATGAIQPTPRRMTAHPAEVEAAIATVVPAISAAYPGLPNARWVALRLLNADERVLQAVRTGELAALVPTGAVAPEVPARAMVGAGVEGDPEIRALLDTLVDTRWRLSPDFHDTADRRALRRSRADHRCRAGDRTAPDASGPRQAARSAADQSVDRLPVDDPAAGAGLLDHHRRRQRAVGDAGHPADRQLPPRAPGRRGCRSGCRRGSTDCSSMGCTSRQRG